MSVIKSEEMCRRCYWDTYRPGCEHREECGDCYMHKDTIMCHCLLLRDGAECTKFVDCDALCEVCNEHINKNLSPSNPACEGRWCDEAFEKWKELNL